MNSKAFDRFALGRLIILDPTNLVVRIAPWAGVAVNTIWYIWLGVTLRRA